MKTFAWLSLVAASVAAQNGIPSGITDACNHFLQSFNSDAKMQSCLKPLITATARFLPSANMQSNQGDVKWAMDQMCSGKSACDQSAMQTTITDFNTACNGDMLSGNQQSLETTFELLYIMTPMIGGVCAKDTDGSYCLSKAKKNGGHTKRGDDQSLLQINTDDWKKSNVQFLFIDANESADQLCTACTKQVMTSYITYETALPYPMGVRSANLLGNQKALWTAINSKCPANYTAAILSSSNATPVNVNDVSAASGASNTVLSITGLVGALMALAATLA